MFLTVTDLNGICEPLYDVKSLKLIEEVNGEYSLSFLIFNSDRNVHAYPLVKEESLIEHNGVEYRIKKVDERNIGERSMKTISAQHTMFDLIDNYVYGTLTGTRTFTQALNFLFEGTGYTYAITDIFSSEDVGDEFGDDNSLSLFQKALKLYQAEYEINGTHFTFRQQIGNQTDTQFRYKHNIKAIDKSVDSSSLSTYIKGYGKPKEEKDVLSGTSIPYASRSGTYYTDPGLNQLATEKVGANFKFSFVGTGFNFKTITTFLGGVWEFTIDGSQSVKISTYEDLISKDKTFEVIRGLENKTHNVVATFKGKDSKNPYTKLKSDPAPIVYLKSGNIIGLYRVLVGDEQYTAVAEYTSPNASIFGIRHAAPVFDERITSNTALLNKLKRTIQDEPELSITVDFVDLRNAGYPYQHPNRGDEILLIYEPMNIEIDVRILRIEEEEDAKGNIISCAVTLANLGKSVSSVMASLGQTSKRISKVLTDDDKIKYDFLDEAVKRATEALQSAQTELEFNNGIIAREKTNPNELVLFNSQGIGISTDGGQTFRTAMTAEGIVADVITAGTIRGIIIEGVEIYGSTIISELDQDNYTKIMGGYLESRGQYNRVWQGQSTTNDVALRLENGYFRARNDSLNRSVYVTDFGISTQIDGINASGTLEFFSFENSDLGRGVTLESAGVTTVKAKGGAVFLDSTTTVNANKPIYSPSIITNSLNGYFGVDGELRVTNKGYADINIDSNLIYRDVHALGFIGQYLQVDQGLNAYVGTDLELRVTSRGMGNIDPTVYRSVRALSFIEASSAKYKTNIELFDADVIGMLKDTSIYTYHLKSNIDSGIYDKPKIGMIAEATLPIFRDEDGVDPYSIASFLFKVCQKQQELLESQGERIADLEIMIGA